jgi:ketosteroid isomerase-like protein
MPAKSPEEICHLFQHAMAEGDIDSVLSVYDPEAVFLNQSRDVTKGREGLRQELTPFAAMRARFDFTIKQVIEAGDIALMHTEWTVLRPQPMKVYAKGLKICSENAWRPKRASASTLWDSMP